VGEETEEWSVRRRLARKAIEEQHRGRHRPNLLRLSISKTSSPKRNMEAGKEKKRKDGCLLGAVVSDRQKKPI